jgi:hypothetical protein
MNKGVALARLKRAAKPALPAQLPARWADLRFGAPLAKWSHGPGRNYYHLPATTAEGGLTVRRLLLVIVIIVFVVSIFGPLLRGYGAQSSGKPKSKPAYPSGADV